MKEIVEGCADGMEKRPAVEVAIGTLREGESFTKGFHMKGGSRYAVTTEGWDNIDAVIITLSDAEGCVMMPEIDETGTVVHFTPPRNGLYELTVVLSALAGGCQSAEVRAVAREMA